MTDESNVLRAGEYFVAVEGLAMMRYLLTDTPRGKRRMEDVLSIVARFDEFPNSLRMPVTEYDVDAGYTRWAPVYDGPNPAIEREEPIVHEWLAEVPPGTALDAACGTGRHAARLAALGHRVIGVDATAAMLDIARTKVPGAEFRQGSLQSLPVDDGSIDVLTCALALTHVVDLGPVLREFARVLRPGGRAILSDIHPFMATTSAVAAFPTEDGGRAVHYVLNVPHQLSEYIAAAHAAGLRVARCEEPVVTEEMLPRFPTFPAWPDATRDAFIDLPYLVIWQFER